MNIHFDNMPASLLWELEWVDSNSHLFNDVKRTKNSIKLRYWFNMKINQIDNILKEEK